MLCLLSSFKSRALFRGCPVLGNSFKCFAFVDTFSSLINQLETNIPSTMKPNIDMIFYIPLCLRIGKRYIYQCPVQLTLPSLTPSMAVNLTSHNPGSNLEMQILQNQATTLMYFCIYSSTLILHHIVWFWCIGSYIEVDFKHKI